MDMSTPMSPKPLVNATCKLGKKGCFADGRCHALGNCENKIVTNADRIRAMSDQELADFLEGDCGNLMIGTALNWLQLPAEEV